MAGSLIYAEASRLWREMRDDYETRVEYEYIRALTKTGGVLLNRRGRALHLDGFDLFKGPWSRAEKYASEELIEYWCETPRISLSQYERTWMDGKGYRR